MNLLFSRGKPHSIACFFALKTSKDTGLPGLVPHLLVPSHNHPEHLSGWLGGPGDPSYPDGVRLPAHDSRVQLLGLYYVLLLFPVVLDLVNSGLWDKVYGCVRPCHTIDKEWGRAGCHRMDRLSHRRNGIETRTPSMS